MSANIAVPGTTGSAAALIDLALADYERRGHE
jgi:hypothetical protein